MRHDPLTLATWIGTPMMVCLLLVAFFGREQPKPHGLVLIADQDGTFLSALVTRAYTQDELGEIFTVQLVPLDEGRRRINSGDGSALVIIPKGFGKAVLGTGQATIRLFTNPSQSIMPDIVESATSVLVEGAWRLQQIAGDDLNRISSDRPPSDTDIAESSVRWSHLATDVRKYLDPPVINVTAETIEPNPSRRQVNIGEAMFSSMTFLAILFLAFGMANDIWNEKIGGTLRHVAVTPSSLAGFFGGKIIALWLVFAALGIIALLSGKFLIGAEIHRAAIAVLWMAACGGAAYVLLVLLNTSFSSRRGATMFSNLLVMTSAMLGGCFFPFELMPNSLERIGRWTPNAWALLRFKDIIAGQINPAGLAMDFVAVLSLTALLSALVAWRLRWRFLF